MTLPCERFASMARSRTFMLDLCDPRKTPGVPKPIRDRARACVKHFPTSIDLDEALYGLRLAAQVFAAVETIPRKMRRPAADTDE